MNSGAYISKLFGLLPSKVDIQQPLERFNLQKKFVAKAWAGGSIESTGCTIRLNGMLTLIGSRVHFVNIIQADSWVG